ncbi:MAG: septum formation inhibitor Maf, partial [Gammaproteobacteria bacterium HGW-Gammaproteobacteria-7]
LRLPFDCRNPRIDERERPDEPARELARRLAHEKALALTATQPHDWIIGCDQVPELAGQNLSKPGDRERTIAQLADGSGRSVNFYTSVCLLHQSDGVHLEHTDLTRANFRTLDRAEIERYIDLEPAFDCAGGFKCEGLGISLFESIQTTDPTALIGLPLIGLSALLRQAGFAVP